MSLNNIAHRMITLVGYGFLFREIVWGWDGFFPLTFGISDVCFSWNRKFYRIIILFFSDVNVYNKSLLKDNTYVFLYIKLRKRF